MQRFKSDAELAAILSNDLQICLIRSRPLIEPPQSAAGAAGPAQCIWTIIHYHWQKYRRNVSFMIKKLDIGQSTADEMILDGRL